MYAACEACDGGTGSVPGVGGDLTAPLSLLSVCLGCLRRVLSPSQSGDVSPGSE